MKGTIMNRSSYIFILPVILLLLGGCSQEELVSTGDNNIPDVTVDKTQSHCPSSWREMRLLTHVPNTPMKT